MPEGDDAPTGAQEFTGQDRTNYELARAVCRAFPPEKVAQDLDINVDVGTSEGLVRIAEKYAGLQAQLSPGRLSQGREPQTSPMQRETLTRRCPGSDGPSFSSTRWTSRHGAGEAALTPEGPRAHPRRGLPAQGGGRGPHERGATGWRGSTASSRVRFLKRADTRWSDRSTRPSNAESRLDSGPCEEGRSAATGEHPRCAPGRTDAAAQRLGPAPSHLARIALASRDRAPCVRDRSGPRRVPQPSGGDGARRDCGPCLAGPVQTPARLRARRGRAPRSSCISPAASSRRISTSS
jgi:hypothetical protein